MLFLAFPLLVTSAFPVPTALPPHSWKTIGDKTFIHGCKAEGLFNASELALASKFPVLTVEKGQGVYLPGYAEDKMAAIAAQWKENRKSMGMTDGWAMFYMNAHFDWTFYRLHAEMLQHPTWAQQQNDHTEGDPCLQNGDPEFPQPGEGMLLFNHSVEDCRNAFIATCVNATTNNGFNGCFIDSAPTEDKLGSSKAAKCKISEIAKRAAGEGGIEMLTELQKSLGSERLIIAKNNFQGGSEEWVNAVMPMDTFCSCYSCTWSTLRSGVTYAQVCQDQILEAIKLGNRGQAPFLHGQVNALLKGNATALAEDFKFSLASFLIAASDTAFFGYSDKWYYNGTTWHDEYDLPLGEPTGPAVQGGAKNMSWTRSFSSGTTVEVDVAAHTATINWAGGK